MFNEIGKKIKVLAKLFFILEVITLVVVSILLMISNRNFVFPGIMIMLIGSLVAWITACFAYGFGELIDKTSEMAHNTHLLEKSMRKKEMSAHTVREERNQRQSKEESIKRKLKESHYGNEERMKREENERRRQAVESMMQEENENNMRAE